MDTNMTTIKPTELVDRDIIAKADAWLAAKSGSLGRAEAAHKVELTALEAALEASELAVAGEGGDPLECALKVEEASRRERVAARVAARVRARAADEHRKASEDRETAGALALKPVHRAWRLRRLEASRKGDAADAARAAAEREYAEATAAMRELAERGLPDLHGALDGPVVFRGEVEERKHWAHRGIDDDHPDHPWHPGKAE